MGKQWVENHNLRGYVLGYAIKGKRKAYRQSSMHKALSNSGYIKVEVWYPNIQVSKIYYWKVEDCKYIDGPIWSKDKERFAWIDEEGYDDFVKRLEPFITLEDNFEKQLLGQIWSGNPVFQTDIDNAGFSMINIIENLK